MSEISEEQAREAARRVKSCRHEDDTDPDDPYDDCFPNAHKVYGCKQIEACIHVGFDLRTLSDYAMQELTRRDAELAEREKPITAEWCVNNGATLDGTAGACQFIAHGIEVEWDARNGVTVRDGERMSDWTFLSSITTRGQLLDLLKALRGGA